MPELCCFLTPCSPQHRREPGQVWIGAGTEGSPRCPRAPAEGSNLWYSGPSRDGPSTALGKLLTLSRASPQEPRAAGARPRLCTPWSPVLLGERSVKCSHYSEINDGTRAFVKGIPQVHPWSGAGAWRGNTSSVHWLHFALAQKKHFTLLKLFRTFGWLGLLGFFFSLWQLNTVFFMC